jgi:subtilisin family serine protease
MTIEMDDALRFVLMTAKDNEVIDVDIFLAGEPAQVVEKTDAMPAARATAMRTYADRAQTSILDELHASSDAIILGQYWVTNSIAARIRPATLRRLLERDDIVALHPAAYGDDEIFDEGMQPQDGAAGAASIPWNVLKTNAPQLWSLGVTGAGVLVAVIDTGVNYRHPDLIGRMWHSNDLQFPRHGWDFQSGDSDPMDQKGHGTACAGIVAGDGTAGTITGVAPAATIMALRVGPDQRNGWDAIQFAIQNQARVVSMSLTWRFNKNPSRPGWRRSCEALLAAGVSHANSVGNDGNDLSTFPIPRNIGTPGDCPPPVLHPQMPLHGGVSSAVSCGATDSTDQLSSSSGRGPVAWQTPPFADYFFNAGSPGLVKPDVCAPGPGSTSCNNRFGIDAGAKPYVSFGGTSAATPHVAGCMALLAHAMMIAGRQPDPRPIFVAIEASARPIVGQSQRKENGFGAGRVDVLAAYHFGRSQGWW